MLSIYSLWHEYDHVLISIAATRGSCSTSLIIGQRTLMRVMCIHLMERGACEVLVDLVMELQKSRLWSGHENVYS